MSKIRTAVVGLNLGNSHAKAFFRSEKADLRWVVDLDEEKAAQKAQEYNCGYATDWRTILDDVDAISFATPHHLHAPMALEAIAAGKHVLMEKPLANSEEDCLKLIRAAEEKQVKLMIAYVVRYRPAIQMLKDLIEREVYGKPFNAHCWIEGYLQPRPDSWFARKDMLGGGVLFSHGCHYIDILQWMLGKVDRVTGLGTRLGTDWMEGEGTYQGVLGFESGALAHLTVSWGMRYKATPALLHVHTPQACLIVSGTKLEVITDAGRQTLYPVEGSPEEMDGMFLQCEHFVDCIREGKQPLTDGYEALKSHRIIWSMYGQNGVPVGV